MDWCSCMWGISFEHKLAEMSLIFFRQALFLLALMQQVFIARAQTPVSESLLQQAVRLTAQLPANPADAYQKREAIKPLFDSLEAALQQAYPLLAERLNRRSARLNGMVNINEPNAKFSLAPPNEAMTNFFNRQWDRMDALERSFNKAAPSFFGNKQLYEQKGYLNLWDSVYRSRLPHLTVYRNGVLKLVQADIAYLKANARMFASKNEDERVQWVEAEMGIVQKLVYLKEKFKKVVLQDGTEKVADCVQYPSLCAQKKQ
jgi:hypothetical protein